MVIRRLHQLNTNYKLSTWMKLLPFLSVGLFTGLTRTIQSGWVEQEVRVSGCQQSLCGEADSEPAGSAPCSESDPTGPSVTEAL